VREQCTASTTEAIDWLKQHGMLQARFRVK
jgi:hypothetical protein